MKLFRIQHIRELERALRLPSGTVARAWSGERGLSAQVHQRLLEQIAERFATAQDMLAWMKRHWPPDLLSVAGPALENFYAKLDQAIPIFGVFPTDYIHRAEETQLLDLLNDPATQVVWITGSGGTGKSTLALSLARRHWPELRSHFDHILWVNGENGDYQDGLRQMAEQLQLPESSHYESNIRQKASHSRFLLLLDTLHELGELSRWRQLIGAQGKLVVASRTRLSDNELRTDASLRQISLGGFSLAQSRAFLRSDSTAIDTLHEKTGGLPLALRILSGLLRELLCPPEQLVQYMNEAALPTLDYPPGVDTRQANLRVCFEITYQTLAEKSPQAAAYFTAMGMFQTRTILKSLLDQAAGVEFETEGDRLLGILLRYNLVEPLSLRSERFVQLHPLIHEFARDKAANPTDENPLFPKYARAVFDWTIAAHHALEKGSHWTSIRIHQNDMQHVLFEWARLARWKWTIHLFFSACDLFLIENPIQETFQLFLARLERLLPVEDNPMLTMLKVMLLVRQATKLSIPEDFAQTKVTLETARTLLQTIRPEDSMEWAYWGEATYILDGLANCLYETGQSEQAINLLLTEENQAVFKHAKSNGHQFMLAEILQSKGEHAQALHVLQEIQAGYDTQQATSIEKTFMLTLQADCHYKLGNLEEATQLYERAFAEEQSPALYRAGYGLDLVACLKKRQQFERMQQVLEIVQDLLAGEENPLVEQLQARVRKYQAKADRQATEQD